MSDWYSAITSKTYNLNLKDSYLFVHSIGISYTVICLFNLYTEEALKSES